MINPSEFRIAEATKNLFREKGETGEAYVHRSRAYWRYGIIIYVAMKSCEK
jgi:hypothetical protein